MRVTPAELEAQYVRASAEWPFIAEVEAEYDLPAFLLYAVGSRETNLKNEVQAAAAANGTRGHGVWQQSYGAHLGPPPAGFDHDVATQARKAANLLAALLHRFADVTPSDVRIRCAMVAYNAGASVAWRNFARGITHLDDGTAPPNGGYSADTYQRLTYLQAHYGETMMTKAEIQEFVDSPITVHRSDGSAITSSIGALLANAEWHALQAQADAADALAAVKALEAKP